MLKMLSTVNFAQLDEEVLRYWQGNKILKIG
jgi:hypothetical protein